MVERHFGSDREPWHKSLAASLLRCMDREAAVHVCKLNGWHGVLEQIEQRSADPDSGESQRAVA